MGSYRPQGYGGKTKDASELTEGALPVARLTGITTSNLSATAGITSGQLAGSIANSKLATDPLARANHTGNQTASTISDFDTEVANNSAVTANTAKVGITTSQANAITANTAKVGITTTQADAITANTAKVGITTTQANAITANTAKNSYPSSDASKLAGIEASATADQTGAQIKTLYEAESNAFTDALFSKLSGLEAGATADLSASEVKTLYESNSNSNEFSDAEQTKLSGIATSANNYTHTTNANLTGDVTSSGNATTIASGAVDNDMLSGSIALSKLASDPLARANHTGTQASSTISGLATSATTDTTNASNISSGTLSDSRIGSFSTSKITSGTFSSSRIPSLATSKITSGTFSTARLGSGSASSSTYLRGDGSWSSISAGGDIEEAYSGVSSGSVNSLNMTGLPYREWYHVIGIMRGNAIGNGAGFNAVSGSSTVGGFNTTAHELRGYTTDSSNSGYGKFLRNSGGQTVGLNLWIEVRTGQLYYHGHTAGSSHESNFSGNSNYNSSVDSNDGLSSINIYNGGGAQSNWRMKVYCPA